MKRLKNVFDKIVSLDNIKLAHRMARKDKTYYKEVKKVDENLDYYANEIRDMLINDEYIISETDYTTQTITDKWKERELWKLQYYPHRIIQWAIMLQLEWMFMKHFCNHTCASIKWRWIHYAFNLTKSYLKDKEWTKYCLKIDIKKFYPSINHNILKQLLRKKIKCNKTLYLLDKIIDSYPWEKWVPIWSYLSQYLANYYLSFFDHYTKEILWCKYVVRYMDDVIILHNSKEYLHNILHHINKYIKSYKLELKWNHQIFPTNIRWIDFVWYRIFYDYVLLRKSTLKRMKRKICKIANIVKLNYTQRCMINSYIWRMKHCNSYRLKQKYIKPICDKLIKYYKTFINNTKMSYVNKLLLNV